MKYVPALDGLRAIAVGLVVLAHMPAVQDVAFTQGIARIAEGLRLGYLGVDIFFVLSGFLVTSILLDDKAGQRFSFLRFYAKRTLRIFPIFYLSLAFCALAFPLPRAEILSNVFYISNYYYALNDESGPLRHTWSLSVEEQFYLIWPLILYLIPARRMSRTLVIGIAAVVVISFVTTLLLVDSEFFGRLVTRGTTFRILSLGAGAVLATQVDRLRAFKPSLILVVMAVAFCGHILSLIVPEPWRSTIGLFSMSGLATSIFCFAYVGSQKRHAYSRWVLESRPLVYLGKISYGIYLYHFIILHALGARESDNPLGVPLATLLLFLALSFAVPALSFHLIEAPLLRLKERLNVQRRSAEAGP